MSGRNAAGNAFRSVLSELGHWGLAHARDRILPTDLDPTILLWGLRKRAILKALPDRRGLLPANLIDDPEQPAIDPPPRLIHQRR